MARLIKRHPILEFKRGKKVAFTFNGREMQGYEGQTIAAALILNGAKVFRKSPRVKRPRGFFCAIGRCASCNMVVNSIPNVRVCVTPLRDGMKVETQEGKGKIL